MTTRTQTADSVPATVLHRIGDDGGIFDVEINETVFTRAKDQREQRRQARLDAIGDELLGLTGDQLDQASRLLGEFEQLWAERVNDVTDYKVRQVGWALITNNLHDLWRVIFARLGPSDNKYLPMACMEFLTSDDVDQECGGHW